MDCPSDRDIQAKRDEIEELSPSKTEELRHRKTTEMELLVNQRLICELEDLRESIDIFRTWSRRLTGVLVIFAFLQVILAVLSLAL
ncbi:hypothetical protein [Natrarchaeobius chitinivorans]|uniref:Uncharacterized protein n=1 Tax=Natrarchaeobius chitinivorans TaxID=1679083 RepID=A0A3N6PI17_NATCH|nr:hypothetical protein [Natrarchaeobius chitinivorans]RQG97835.1 hypothetical protein EA473_01125 [Natrarchaeobius chitinivorans]